jgi:dienelactone hydrolase
MQAGSSLKKQGGSTMSNVTYSLGLAMLCVAATISFAPKLRAEAAPPTGGGYTDVIPIPVNDATTKAIAGALFKPTGAGPFPAIIYLSGCGGIDNGADRVMQKAVIEHYKSMGVATLIVDPFTPRGEKEGVCADLADPAKAAKGPEYFARDSNDALAAVKLLKSMSDIDAKHIFLQGYSFGAIGSLTAIDKSNPASREANVAGLVAYYPFCFDGVDPSVPVLVLIGEKDDWTPAAKCKAVTGKTDFNVIVYPGDTHAFTMNFGKPIDFAGHHMEYDEKATQDAEQRAEAFITAHLK